MREAREQVKPSGHSASVAHAMGGDGGAAGGDDGEGGDCGEGGGQSKGLAGIHEE